MVAMMESKMAEELGDGKEELPWASEGRQDEE